jgi:hypothetical protein
MKTKKWFFIISVVLVVSISCSKPKSEEETGSSGNPTTDTNPKDSVNATVSKGEIPMTKFPLPEEFCSSVKYDLIAGQTIDNGDITIGNTKDSLFISINSITGFTGTENIKIWVGKTAPVERGAAGQYPYKYTVANGVSTFYAGFPFAELGMTSCSDQIYLIIHCDVPGETAFGGTSGTMQGGAGTGTEWFYSIHFSAACCSTCNLSASSVQTNVLCFNSATGAIDLTVSGGTAPFNYLWSNGATTEDISGLTAGTYSVTITDSRRCTFALGNILISQPASAITASAVVTNISVFGAKDGKIDVTTSGGTPPYSLLWSNGATTEDLSGLAAGTYTLTITDANKCTKIVEGVVNEGNCPNIVVTGVFTDASCGGNDGAIDLTVTGGTAPYTYLWSPNNATTEDLTGLSEGEYTVVVYDANKCKGSFTATINKESCEPKGIIAFARKTYEPMAHCFLSDPALVRYGFTQWGWTNGALPENEGFTSRYELFINAGSCDVANATKVGDIAMQHSGGKATVTFTMLPGYTMEKTSLYVGNDMLPKDGGTFTIDPDKYPYQHSLSGAVSDTYSLSVSGDVYLIGYALVSPAVPGK